MNKAENVENLGDFDELYLSLDILNSQRAAKGKKKVLQLNEAENISHCPTVANEQRCHVDRLPFLCFASGLLVDNLLSTGAYCHVDFISIDRIKFNYDEKTSYLVPFSKEDVFSSNQFTLLEKRKIMKAIGTCPKSQGNSTFYHYLSQIVGLDDRICKMIIFSICFSDNLNISAREGINRCKLFTSSINKFNQKSPLLYPIYGSDEIPQAFCRICAVNGGVQVPTAKEIFIDEDFVYFSFEGTKYKAKFSSNCTISGNGLFTLYRAHTVEQSNIQESYLNVHNVDQVPVYELVLNESSRCIPQGHLIRFFWSCREESLSRFLFANGSSSLEICRFDCNSDVFH